MVAGAPKAATTRLRKSKSREALYIHEAQERTNNATITFLQEGAPLYELHEPKQLRQMFRV